MGTWGIKALESDNGLDLLSFLEALYAGRLEMSLQEIISEAIAEGYLGEDHYDIDYLYDNTALSIAELLLMFKSTGELDYDSDDDNDSISLRKKKIFTYDKKSIDYLLQYLTDIKAEKTDEDEVREFTALWKESNSYKEWSHHLDKTIRSLQQLK